MLEAILRLSCCPGVGSYHGKQLISLFNTPEEIFSCSEKELIAKSGINAGTVSMLRDPELLTAARKEIKQSKKQSIKLIAINSPDYPECLHEIPAPPLVLRVKGELPLPPSPAVAVVGTRRASPYGRRQTVHFVRELASCGLTIVSGLARGIDGIAHEEALRAGGKTIAVLGSGLGRIYPPEHRHLAEKIARNGAVVSEFPLFSPPLAYHFPQRNRIISGLSLGILVIEGGKKSGTMITATCAADQGRTVFAVPGNTDSVTSEGTNQLIREGAVLTAKAEDIIDELGIPAPLHEQSTEKNNPRETPHTALSPVEKNIYEAIPKGPVFPQAISRKLGISMNKVMAALTSLELKQYLRRYGERLEKI